MNKYYFINHRYCGIHKNIININKQTNERTNECDVSKRKEKMNMMILSNFQALPDQALK